MEESVTLTWILIGVVAMFFRLLFDMFSLIKQNSDKVAEWISNQPAARRVSHNWEPENVQYDNQEEYHTCSVCLEVPRCPMVFYRCISSHIVCSHCLPKLFNASNSNNTHNMVINCPMCRGLVLPNQIVDIHYEIKHHPTSSLSKFYLNATVACSNKGCPETKLPILTIDSHENIHCPYRLLKCTSPQCSILADSRRIEFHLNICKRQKLSCSRCDRSYSIKHGHCCFLPPWVFQPPHGVDQIILPPNSKLINLFDNSLLPIKNKFNLAKQIARQSRRQQQESIPGLIPVTTQFIRSLNIQ